MSTAWGKHCIKLIKAIRLIALCVLLLLLLLALGGLGEAAESGGESMGERGKVVERGWRGKGGILFKLKCGERPGLLCHAGVW